MLLDVERKLSSLVVEKIWFGDLEDLGRELVLVPMKDIGYSSGRFRWFESCRGGMGVHSWFVRERIKVIIL